MIQAGDYGELRRGCLVRNFTNGGNDARVSKFRGSHFYPCIKITAFPVFYQASKSTMVRLLLPQPGECGFVIWLSRKTGTSLVTDFKPGLCALQPDMRDRP